MRLRFWKPENRLEVSASAPGRRPSAGRLAIVAALAVALGLGVAACGSSSDSGGTINLIAYSTPETVYDKALIPAFDKTSQGEGAKFSTSFGPSGDQQRAVIAGQPADYVHFSTGPDMQAVVDAGLVDSNWDQNKYNGIVQDSVVVFVVRKGNPKNIQTWDDLVKPGVQVVTPNVFSSGGAKWNLLAAYGAQIEEGKSPTEALAFLKSLLEQRGRPAGQRQRRADDIHERQGRRPALLRERCDRGSEGRRGRRLRHPRRHDPDRDARRDHDRRLDAGPGLPHVPVDAGGAAVVGGRRLPARGPVSARQEQVQVPDSARAVHR